MNLKTSDWKRIVREITNEIKSLRKEIDEIKKIDKIEYEKLGINSSMEPYASLEVYEETTRGFPMYNLAAESRMKKLESLRTKKNYFEKLLLGIKCIALYRSKNLSKAAERNGFVDNKSYADALVKNEGYSIDEVIDILNKYFMEDNFSFDHFRMEEKSADSVGKMFR